MIEEAVITIGLTYNEFLNMTMYQYRLCIERYLFASTEALKHTRLIAYQIFCTTAKDKLSIEQYMPLRSDKKAPEREVSKERLLEMQEQAAKRYEIIKNIQNNT